MYTSPDDARSDLMLAGAVFIFGPIVVGLLLATVPLGRIPLMGSALSLAVPAVLTILVPFLLVRYRRESWADYGFGAEVGQGAGTGIVIALPLVVAGLAVALLSGQPATAALPALAIGPAWALQMGVRLITWVGLAVLAVFVTVKARDAFRADYRTIPEAMVEIGRIVALVAAGASLLRLVTTQSIGSLILPLGVAGMGVLVYRGVKGPTSVSRAALLTPTVLLAIGSLFISFSAARLVEGIWTGALVAAVGLIMGVLREHRGSAWVVITLAVAIALFTPLPVPLRLG